MSHLARVTLASEGASAENIAWYPNSGTSDSYLITTDTNSDTIVAGAAKVSVRMSLLSQRYQASFAHLIEDFS